MIIHLRIKLHVKFTRLDVDRLNIVLPPDASPVIDRNHLDSPAPLQHTPAAVAAVEHDMLGIRRKVARS